jgi:hypothetical protein
MIAVAALLLFASAGDASFDRGEQFMRQGRYDEAARQYVDALIADPAHPHARIAWRRARYELAMRTARGLQWQGRVDEARKWTESAREFLPPMPEPDWRPWAALGGAAYVVSLICTLYFGLRSTLSERRCL